jgi:cytochrome oxidase Cu insertion factor (SCO1/SenC/PrrC family)
VFKPSINLLARSAAIAAILFIASAPAAAGNAPADAADAAAAEAKARDYFSNVELVDQDGRSLKFYDEVLKDNIVVISFIFTNCQSACPLMTRNLTMIRDMLREDERRSIQFISISIDPLRDTPSAMKEFAQKASPTMSITSPSASVPIPTIRKCIPRPCWRPTCPTRTGPR